MFTLMKYVSKNITTMTIIVKSIKKVLFLFTPLVSAKFIDGVVESNYDEMFMFGLIAVLIYVLVQIFNYLEDLYLGKVTVDSYVNIFNKIDENMKDIDYKNSELNESTLNQEIGQNFELIKTFIFEKPVDLIFAIITIVAILIISFLISPINAITILIVVPITVWFTVKYGDRISKNSLDNLKDMKNIKGIVVDRYKLSKQDRFLEEKQLGNINASLETYKINALKKYKLEAYYDNIIIYGLLNGIILLSTLLSGYLAYKNIITIGMIFTFQIYTSQFWTPINSIVDIRKSYLVTKPAINTFTKFIDINTIMYENDKVESINLINFRSLNEKEQFLHKPINITFEKGKIYIIKGENGVGKTTLVEAIMGFNIRYSGEIHFHSEENKILKSEIKDIVYIEGNCYISKYGVLNEYVNGSFGEKKLAQINHCLKSEKTIYVFDEPTNFLDKENSLLVESFLKNLKDRNKIVIAISHDREFISRIADEVIEIN